MELVVGASKPRAFAAMLRSRARVAPAIAPLPSGQKFMRVRAVWKRSMSRSSMLDVGEQPVRDEDGFGALEVGVAGHDLLAGGFGECDECGGPAGQAIERGVDGVADEEAGVGGDLLVAAAAGVELEGEGADLFGEFELDVVVDVFGLRGGGDDGGFDLLVAGLVVGLAAGGGDAVRPVLRAAGPTRREAGEGLGEFFGREDAGGGDGLRAWALLAATSCGRRRQSKGKLRCHCSKVRSSGSRKRPDHIFAG